MPSISPNRPAVTIDFDRPRPIRFTWSSICDFEETYKKSLPKAFTEDVGPRLLTYVSWAGMLHAEPNVTISQVKSRINRYLENGGDIGVLSTNLMKALLESGVLGKPKAPGAEDEEPEGNASAASEEPAP